MQTEKLTITIEDWVELGYKGELEFLCACGCGKKFRIDVLDWKPRLTFPKKV